MCGIAGFYDKEGRVRYRGEILRRMVASIHHRGPDAQGTYLEGGVALGHARLSIIDLSSGGQPMGNEDGSVQVTFNGEIFNYVELREELISQGHTFRTHSDTETIVHQYEKDGPECVQSFNGDFAYAIWDEKRRRLTLTRDRMGVRPLYYTFVDGVLVFASEMKALFEFPGVEAEIDPVALDQTFTFWFPLAPRTPFKNIHELPPGHTLVFDGKSVNVNAYWKLSYMTCEEDRAAESRSEEEIVEELQALLIDSTRIRLRADVPVGAYLSGGLDSSLTTALIRKFSSNRLRTFSVGFESAEFDETAFQYQMVRALETDHSAVACRAGDIAHEFPEVLRHTERPILRTAPAPLYLLSKLVRENGFKVVMTGEGADEVFAGYDIFKEAKVRQFWARQPSSKSRPLLLQRLYPYLPGVQSQPQAYLEAFFKVGLENPGDSFFSHLPRWGMTAKTKVFFSDGILETLNGYNALEELRGTLPEAYGSWTSLSQAQYLEAAHLLPGYILSSQGDRMAMANGVEGRFPFLDHRVVEFAARIPSRLRLKGLTEKHILRKSAAPYLPPSIADRPKQPYRAPESASFFGPDAPDYVEELLSPAAISNSGYFHPKSVEKLAQKCRSQGAVGFKDNMALVGVLSVQLLDRMFVQRRSVSAGTQNEALVEA